jgi:hypothetical protein
MAARAHLLALLVGVVVCAGSSDARAQGCADDDKWVWASGGMGVGAGAAGALAVAGALSLADDTRDFEFGVGAGVGIGVTAGLSALYTVVDLSTNCGMARESDGIVWSVPIAMLIVGSLLPLAVWGASDEVGEPAEEPPPATMALPLVRF